MVMSEDVLFDCGCRSDSREDVLVVMGALWEMIGFGAW